MAVITTVVQGDIEIDVDILLRHITSELTYYMSKEDKKAKEERSSGEFLDFVCTFDKGSNAEPIYVVNIAQGSHITLFGECIYFEDYLKEEKSSEIALLEVTIEKALVAYHSLEQSSSKFLKLNVYEIEHFIYAHLLRKYYYDLVYKGFIKPLKLVWK